MKAFLTAILILLLLIALMICHTVSAASLSKEMAEQTASLPSAGEEDCLAAVTALEAIWARLRPFARAATHVSTVEQIDHLVAALRVTAEMEAAVDFEINRRLLSEALREYREMVLCGLWAIL